MKRTHRRLLLCAILLYGLIVSLVDLDYNSVFIDEAFQITMGQEIIRGEPCLGCPHHTGSVMIWPVLAALADSAGGIHAVRILTVVIGLALTVIVYATAAMLFGGNLGLIAAALFMCTGQTLYLMKLGTYDMIAAFFIGASFFMFVVSACVKAPWHRNLAIVFGAAALFLASITKYLLPVFVPSLVLYVLVKHGIKRTALFCVLPLAVLGALYLGFDQYAPRMQVLGQVETYANIKVPLATMFEWAFRWIALVLLLAVFGVFHERHGKTAIALIALSSPIIILHLVTRAEQSVNKNMIFALIFLVPAAALGVEHLARIFSSGARHRMVRGFFTVSILVIFWAYGLFNLHWLERQYPDVTPLIEFFETKGFDGMTVAFNGWDGVIYEYVLGDRYPHARFLNMLEIRKTDSPRPAFAERVDFVVCEDLFYGKMSPCSQFEPYFEDGYVLLRNFTIEHSWGETDAQIYGRR
ncbi:MAG: hypothetical protein NTW97_12435 [Candidatus Krumholzibacteria bacterium]|nr:hypothetical protein [Candidatus Krumholzibacteria bacterium]